MEIILLNEQQSNLQQPRYVHHHCDMMIIVIKGDIWVDHFETGQKGMLFHIRQEVNQSGQKMSLFVITDVLPVMIITIKQ